uniref:Reverse transcriptase N-terminal domain-containing protein n=1 Tax=Schimmelmannia schousboei TaxID=173468 RepID=A0A1C9C8M8_9FLOR|nr:hypothetical protein Schim_057 [Schimmelmannia schousboei]AOM64738.1 hypothetical protein Schim_057 [Schimmelmannia schousboei]
MKAYNLSQCTQWKNLPWHKLNNRILFLQKKIFIYSKKCNKKNVYKIQQSILNSYEAKVIAIQNIFTSIHKYYFYYNKEIYYFSDKDKFFIFKFLFKKHIQNKYINIIITKIKQYLVYLCIQPEWEAKFEPSLQSNINSLESYTLQSKLIKYFSQFSHEKTNKLYNIYLKYKIYHKYLDIKYLINKLQTLPYISNSLNLWIEKQALIEVFYNHDCIQKCSWKIAHFNILYKFLCKILFNGLEWYNLTVLQFEQKNYNLFQHIFLIYNINNESLIYFNHSFLNLSLYKNIKFIYQAIRLNIYYLNDKILNTYFERESINYSIICHNLSIINISQIYKQILKQIKLIIYHKDIKGRLRANTNLKISTVIFKLNNELKQIYQNYCIFLNENLIQRISNAIKIIIYNWSKKKYKYKDHLNIKYIKQNILSYKKKILYKIYKLEFNR